MSQRDVPEPAGGGAAELTRRGFLREWGVAAAGVVATGAALRPIFDEAGRRRLPSMAELLQKHYKELSPEEMEEVLARITTEVEETYGVKASVRDVKPCEGVEFVYALDLSRCIGCRKCVHACAEENNTSRDPEVQYIRVLELPLGTMDLERADHHYDPALVPREGHWYLPVQCQQCADPPCVAVCPVEATWVEADGICVVDYDWCIGCRYCEAACPYWARRFNFAEPKLAGAELRTDMAYLSNRPREAGVVEKCTYCLHRTREGGLPACLEACPVGARKFGDIRDPRSEVARILRERRVFVLKEEQGTLPRFFYFFDERRADAETFERPDPDAVPGDDVPPEGVLLDEGGVQEQEGEAR